MQLNSIGLEQAKAEELAAKLNELLANYQVFYMNVRGFHWNVKGEKFFELHLKFEELYNDLLLKVDETAERILTLGYRPLHSYTDYIAQSDIREATNATDGRACVAAILEGLKTLLLKQRSLQTLAAEAGDEGTASMVSDYIRQQEKLVWMYSAFMG